MMSHGNHIKILRLKAAQKARVQQSNFADTDCESERNFCLFLDFLSRQLDGFMVMDQRSALFASIESVI